MELRHLKYFVAVAEELHFARAAIRVHIAQPSLSKQIQQLEQELGFPLFYRTKQRVELLDAGHVFLDEARRILRQAEDAVEQWFGGETAGLPHYGPFSMLLELNIPRIERLLLFLDPAERFYPVRCRSHPDYARPSRNALRAATRNAFIIELR